MLKKIKKNPIIKISYSLKLTVLCLLILAILTLLGTIYQSNHGLYEAKLKFFSSWIFLLGGFIPFPGGALTMTVLFINLLSSLFFRIGFRWSNTGNILTHIGILILLLGGFYTFLFSQESFLSLKEGTGSDFSNSYDKWELAIWTESGGERDIYAIDTSDFSKRKSFSIPELKIEGKIRSYYKNCTALKNGSISNVDKIINASNITTLKASNDFTEPSRNVPGIILSLNNVDSDILLYGNEDKPTPVIISGNLVRLSLRKKRYQLPFYLKLSDFNMGKYPGSEIVKSYDSFVQLITSKDLNRSVHISMNKPLRYKDFTLFQSSYYIDPSDGTEYSVFAVVKNRGKYLPYISSILIFLGLIIHFVFMLSRKKIRSYNV